MPQPTYRTTVGIGKETTYGTAVVGSFFIPVTASTPVDKLDLLKDTGWRGSAVDSYGHVPGPIFSNFDFGGDVFPDAIGFPLAGVLGDVGFTVGPPNIWAMAVLNSGTTQPPSYTLVDTTSINALSFPGMKFSDVGIKFDGSGKLEYTAKAVGLTSAIVSAPTPSYTALPITAAWTGIVSLGGTPVTAVASGEINIKRAVDPIHTVDGTQAPYTCWSGPVTCDGKLVLVMEADTYRAQYVAGTAAAVDINFAAGAGATATQIKLHCSKATFTKADQMFGKSYVELDIDFTADANTTDVGASAGYSPVLVTLKNAIATGIYA